MVMNTMITQKNNNNKDETTIQVSPVFTKLLQTSNNTYMGKYRYRYIIAEGGSRSSKSYSLLQLLVLKAISSPDENIAVVMRTLADLKRTILKKSLSKVLQSFKGISYKYNKSEHIIYFQNGSIISFIGADDEATILGVESTYLWIDEANNLRPSTMRQLFQRCTKQIFLSYNPAGDLKFIDEYKSRQRAIALYSTYKDNPFITQEVVDELEGFKETDYNHYLIYTLGKRAVSREAIYQHFITVKEKPEGFNNYIYGMDFGHGTNAVVKVWYKVDTNEVYLEQIVYSHEQSVTELLKELQDNEIDKNDLIIADSNAPAIIKDIKKLGFNILKASKPPGSVLNGINYIKTLKVYVHEDSIDILNEVMLYKWKKVNGEITDVPEKKYDHACFSGDTLITTDKGDVRIDSINVGDVVLTSDGYKKVLNVFNNGIKETNKLLLKFSDKTSILTNVTDDHLYKIKYKKDILWKTVKEINTLTNQIFLLKRDISMLISKEMKNRNIMHTSMEKDLFVMKTIDILKNIEYICTTMYGNTLTENEIKICTYTTLMVILGTMTYQTWNKSTQRNISQDTCKKMLKMIQKDLNVFQTQHSLKQPSGINLKRVKNGINNMENSLGSIEHIYNTLVSNVVTLLNQDILKVQNFATEHVNQDIVKNMIDLIVNASYVEMFLVNGNTIKQKELVTSTVLEKQREEVYDLEVEDIHEYFANGILVHNCDSFRYAIMYLKKKNMHNRNGKVAGTKFMRV